MATTPSSVSRTKKRQKKRKGSKVGGREICTTHKERETVAPPKRRRERQYLTQKEEATHTPSQRWEVLSGELPHAGRAEGGPLTQLFEGDGGSVSANK